MKAKLSLSLALGLFLSITSALAVSIDLSGHWEGSYINNQGQSYNINCGVYQKMDSIFGTVVQGEFTYYLSGKLSDDKDSIYIKVVSKTGSITNVECLIVGSDSVHFNYSTVKGISLGSGGVKRKTNTRTLVLHYTYSGAKKITTDAPLGIRIYDDPNVLTVEPVVSFEFTKKSGTLFLSDIPASTIYCEMYTGFNDSMTTFSSYTLSYYLYGSDPGKTPDPIVFNAGGLAEITVNFDDTYPYTIPASFPNGKLPFLKSFALKFQPAAISASPSGDIFIINKKDQKIHKYNKYVDYVDSLKDNNGAYILSDFLTFAPDGSFYTYTLNNLKHYNSNGTLLHSRVIGGYPIGMAVDANSNLFLATGACVFKYNPDLSTELAILSLTKIKSDYPNINVNCSISAIGIDKNNKIILGIDAEPDNDGKDVVLIYNNTLTTLENHIWEEWLFNKPSKCAVDESNNLFVISYWHDLLTGFDKDYNRSTANYYVDMPGETNGALTDPVDFAISNNYIFLVETSLKKLNIYGLFCPQPLVSTEQKAICQGESLTWHGKQIRTAGTYYDSLKTKLGCDSIFKLELTVKSVPVTPVITAVANKPQLSTAASGSIQWYTSNGNAINGATSSILELTDYAKKYYIKTSVNGCTSIASDAVSLQDLVCVSTFFQNETKEICTGETYSWHGKEFSKAGNYYDSLKTKFGCDSIYKLVITTKAIPATPIITAVANKAQLTTTANGALQWYSSEGVAVNGANNSILELTDYNKKYYVKTTANGCSSLASEAKSLRDLVCTSTLLYPESKEICANETYTWHGRKLDKSGIYYDSLKTQFGCDSVFKLDLTVKPVPAKPTIAAVANKVQLSANASGSIVWQTLNGLIIDGANNGTFEVADVYKKYYAKTIVNGCVSEASDTVSLHDLACTSSMLFSETKELCAGEIYNWLGEKLSKSGIYYDSLLTKFGCDSIFKLNLTIKSEPAAPVITFNTSKNQIESSAEKGNQWFTVAGGKIDNANDATLTNPKTGEKYYSIVNVGGCNSKQSNIIEMAVNTGINILSDAGISIYPNPTASLLNIKIEEGLKLQSVVLTDVSGRQVLTIDNLRNSESITADITALPQGMYYLVVKSNKGTSAHLISKR
jgi:hypothetical protein